jgi:DNA helicase-2/ATP-dependent DNA helicase PcrA
MQAITATIQKEQNKVIRYPDVPVLLVEGIAGSGKTSVLLQRIAYLFYQKRNTLRPDHVCLMTLNPVFRDYIDNVLPDMGETNPLTLTWNEFTQMVRVPFEDNEYDYTEAENLKKIRDIRWRKNFVQKDTKRKIFRKL